MHHHYNGVTKITPTKDWKKGKIQHSSVKEDNWIIRAMVNVKKSNQSEQLGIYCHIPFCVKKCAYCDFSSFECQDEKMVARYFKALYQEIINFAGQNKDTALTPVDTIYFGGGTPSSVEPVYIETTLALLKEAFFITDEVEITIEINPGTLTLEKARRYKNAGINRISVGLQAWQDCLLKILGRVHRQAEFIDSMQILKTVGFNNFSVDVMYGLPGQKLEDIMETVQELMTFSPTHLSCYSLILEDGTPMANWVEAGQLELPSEDDERKMHWAIDRFLKEHGYDHYEISSYCQPGYESRHNLKYWELVPYLGFGLGAHGYFKGKRYGNANKLLDYCKLIEMGKSASVYEPEMSPAELMSDWMFLGLRKLGGIRDDLFKERFGRSFFDQYETAINSQINEGLLEWDGSILKLTATGQDFGNRVFAAFV